PYRGSWLDFEFDHKDYLYVRIDKKRKIPATVILRALGFTTKQILDYYYKKEKIYILGNGQYAKSLEFDIIADQRADRDIKNPKTGEIIVRKNMKFTPAVINKLKNAGVTSLPIEAKDVEGKVVSDDVIDEDTGEVILQTNEELTEAKLKEIEKRGIKEVSVLFIDNLNVGPYIRKTLISDKLNSTEEALLELHRKLRPGEPATVEAASDVFYRLFFDLQKYDLSKVGRLKLNYKFHQDEPLDNTVLTRRDILETVRYLVEIRDGKGHVDDIDHLGNRRIRPVGELVENQYRIGLVRMERIVKEKMGQQEIDTIMPTDLINSKPVVGVIKEFFGSSQLSQFMDQTNPLSELAHKRRLSALGPGGLTRERAGFEVRDVHPTHYGRICPIETPEGPNIGLIASLASYARVNEFGFIESPYRRVSEMKVSSEVEYLNALDEERHIIAQATINLDRYGRIADEIVSARRQGEFALVKPEEVSLMDVSTNQMVSIAAGLIPFLEHDDANRALMGSNMQRQAVPLIVSESPFVGTGIEKRSAIDAGAVVVAKRSGVVKSVDSQRIVVKVDKVGVNESPVDIYNLVKWQKTNQNNCFNQKPIVRVGDYVEAGDVLADGPTTDLGELSLGRNVLVAFVPWSGYNFEDAIILSERLVKEDVFTSIHIEEFECIARDTKLGKEEITRDIPGISEEALKDLDESGVVRIGAEVKHGDVLVGKITPKADTQLSPEEKLLKAIFGEKAGDVKDTSLVVPPGVKGVVIDAQVYTREAIDKDERARSIRQQEEARLTKELNDQIKIINDSIYSRLRKILKDHEAKNRVQDPSGKTIISKGKKLTQEVLDEISDDLLEYIEVTDAKTQQQIQQIIESRNEQIDILKLYYKERTSKLNRSDELPTGVIKMVKVYVATKRKIQVGDKMAGRHGNKGVISKILREEDLPYLPDGTPVDIVLNPLGVPSRMNVGQILETHLGWAAKGLGLKIGELIKKVQDPDKIRKELKSIYDDEIISNALDNLSDDAILELARRISKSGIHFATPVFDGAREEDIKRYLEKAGLPQSGQTILFDG
ncbi:MAG: DNA-directed RNA polymerase subunit beta, partial [Myxococcota bacterium]